MKDFHPPILKLLEHYADVTGSSGAQRIIEKRTVESEAEARTLLAFLDVMFNRVIEDSKRNVCVLSQAIIPSDGEKVILQVHGYLEELGYGHLVSPDD